MEVKSKTLVYYLLSPNGSTLTLLNKILFKYAGPLQLSVGLNYNEIANLTSQCYPLANVVSVTVILLACFCNLLLIQMPIFIHEVKNFNRKLFLKI